MLKSGPLLEETFTVKNIYVEPREAAVSVHGPTITTSQSCRGVPAQKMFFFNRYE